MQRDVIIETITILLLPIFFCSIPETKKAKERQAIKRDGIICFFESKNNEPAMTVIGIKKYGSIILKIFLIFLFFITIII